MGKKEINSKPDGKGKNKRDDSFDYRRIMIVSDVVEELRIKQSILESSINGLAIGDLEGNLTYVNNAALELFGGYDESEVLGHSAVMFAWSADEALEALSQVREKGGWTGDITGKKKDGSAIFVNLSANRVNNEEGEPICMMCSFIDITERKQIEDELRIKDNAIASSINGIGIADLEGRITYINDAALAMWGADDPSEVLGKSPLDFAEDQEEAERIFVEFIEKGGWTGEVSGKRKDGSPITILITASLVRNEKGEPICMMDSFVDITARKKMEEELRIKDSAIRSSINGIAIADLEGNITYVNEAFLELWGGEDVSEILGKSAVTFAESEEEGLNIIAVLMRDGNWIGEITGIRKDGIPVTVQLSASMVSNEKGDPICLMCSFVDITKRKEAEDRLQRSHEELEIKVQERTQELTKANIQLKKEIDERKEAEKALLRKERELELKSLNLEESNTALKVLLRQGEKDKTELENKVLTNIKELVMPGIEKLRSCRLDDKQKAYVNILESNLDDIISPFLQKLSSKYMDFTPTEIQVANLVREGKPTKEISELLNISERGIEFHRNNIRMKLGLKNRKTNLRTYLLSLN
jgi:PAS domain S-box-containing protein